MRVAPAPKRVSVAALKTRTAYLCHLMLTPFLHTHRHTPHLHTHTYTLSVSLSVPDIFAQRSPFFPSLLLSVGGNSLSLWHDKAPNPLLQYRLPGARISPQ